MSDAEARAEHGYAQAEELERLEATIATLREQLRAAETHYATAMRVNEQRRQENDDLRRLLVAVLPPDALYQEARNLCRALRPKG